ncbi:MAG: hypothetical protein JSW45_02615 [Thiotrichales bacterium]|nr:MAG: hypothetical protein JSW45_02615 [Thiotrichales bacterium]
MKNPVVVVGIGEMGSVFARGFLRLGFPVYPVVRDTDMAEMATQVEPELVVVAVAENDIQTVLEEIPRPWRNKLVLLQNELLPGDWTRHNLEPTVISVWFEKKKGMDSKVILPSPVYGRHAQLVADALNAIDIAARVLASDEDLLFELVLKNVYILTANVSGLQTGGTVGELWSRHQDIAAAVAGEIIQLQEKLTGRAFDSTRLVEAMVHAFEGDPEHGCRGRSAAARLERALKLADQHGLDLPQLKHIASIQ